MRNRYSCLPLGNVISTSQRPTSLSASASNIGCDSHSVKDPNNATTCASGLLKRKRTFLCACLNGRSHPLCADFAGVSVFGIFFIALKFEKEVDAGFATVGRI